MVSEEGTDAFVYNSNHFGSVVLTIDGVLPSSRLVLMGIVDTGTLLVKSRKQIRNVGRKSPWLLEVGVLCTPRRSEIVLTAIEVGEEEVHPLHESTNTVLLPIGAIPRPFDDQVDPIGGVRIAQSNEVLPKSSEELPMASQL